MAQQNNNEEVLQFTTPEYTTVEGKSGYVDHGEMGSDYLFQIVDTKLLNGKKTIEKGLELTPALRKLFSAIQSSEIIEPDPDAPHWTVKVVGGAANPFLKPKLEAEYPEKIIEILNQ